MFGISKQNLFYMLRISASAETCHSFDYFKKRNRGELQRKINEKIYTSSNKIIKLLC